MRRRRRTQVDTLTVAELTFAVRWSRRRRTIGITVRRDGELRVAAPHGLPLGALQAAVREKLPWVRRKLADLAAAEPAAPPPTYADGEPVQYLGRRYRLAHVEGGPGGRPARLYRGRLEVTAADPRGALETWYAARAGEHLARRVAHFAPLVGAAPTAVVVRDLGRRRWGICHCGTRVITLHARLITQTPAGIDYVVVHELAHLLEPNHQHAFWQHVERVLPDWRTRRRKLAPGGPHDAPATPAGQADRRPPAIPEPPSDSSLTTR